jgi:DNA mismatch endonuclease (patch repair protein)
MDKFSSQKRSQIMAKVKGRDTKPERVVRQLVTAMGCRYRLHKKELPGRPDLAFIGRKKVIFVNGCFWHQHPKCKRASRPATNQPFWKEKLDTNIKRDKQTLAIYEQMKWETLIIWECETKDLAKLQKRLKDFLDN